MKKNNKGFTLIELLAVIVILAVIALISTPAVMNVINQSRQKAAEDSAYGVVESVKSYHAQRMLNTITVKDTITVVWTTSGSTTTTTVDGTAVTDLNITGKKPTGGTVTILANGNVTVTDLLISGYKCSMAENANMSCSNNA